MYCALASIVSDKKSAVTQIVFPLAAFKFFSVFLVSRSLIPVYPDVNFFVTFWDLLTFLSL